jgi:glutamate synthase (NADPH/NADH) large chain
MRKCHLNTCPVGVATQDPVLRKRFRGAPEHVINYFFFVAEEVRELLAAAGFRSVAEVIGHTDILDQTRLVDHFKARHVDFSRVFVRLDAPPEEIRRTAAQAHPIDTVLDRTLIERARPALENGEPVEIVHEISNVDRAVGAMLSG